MKGCHLVINKIKNNQMMKFGQLIGYNTKNIFLEKSYTKHGGDTFPRPFSKNSKLSYLWISSLKFYTACLKCMPSLGLSKYIETKLQTTWFDLVACSPHPHPPPAERGGAHYVFSAWSKNQHKNLNILRE